MTTWTHLGSPEEKAWGMKSLLMLSLKLTCSVTESKTLLNSCFQPNTEGAAPIHQVIQTLWDPVFIPFLHFTPSRQSHNLLILLSNFTNISLVRTWSSFGQESFRFFSYFFFLPCHPKDCDFFNLCNIVTSKVAFNYFMFIFVEQLQIANDHAK